ncbi:cytospin-A isoform X2 [Betta splendens]|uniref:Cytospin-A n=1 Tax=Betta splendens TaxID=158456 RepID=A0A6P7LNT6_BETSP|nr:cytospin-A isoform X2 [Betta splendens]XP_028995625.1 cytospin-A isoform X2 [Betta splendens]
MGNFSSKDGHGPTGSHGESFHTPPASPQSDGAVPPLLHHSSPKPSHAAPASPPPPVPVGPSTGKKPQPGPTPSAPCGSSPAPQWRPQPAVGSAVVPPVPNKPGAGAGTGLASSGRNGGPPTSTPRTAASPEASASVGAARCPSSPGCSSSGPGWRERDSGLSQSLLPGHEAGDVQGEELEKLLEECRATLGIRSSQDGATNAEVLRHLLSEVKNLRSTLQTERGEWLQFQADLQVAVAVADRLRAEAEEELTSLRAAHDGLKKELAVAQRRRKEVDGRADAPRGEPRESGRRPAAPGATEGSTDSPCPEPERPDGDAAESGAGRRGRERAPCGSGPDGGGPSEAADRRSGTKRCLRNATNEERNGDEGRHGEAPKTAATERSRSLSRLPAASDPPTIHNGTQLRAPTAAGPTNRNLGQLRGQRSLDWLDSRSSVSTGKREESLNKYNAALSECPPNHSQDGFNLLLRRHRGSKRNSLLRWCQNQTQGYKNIDITNFSSSWADGLAFCAVYHSYLPSHIPYSALTPENKRENLGLAFKTGESVGIAQTLTLEEVLRAGGPDWQRVLSYVESMYRHFEM